MCLIGLTSACLNEDGNLTYRIKVDAKDFLKDTNLIEKTTPLFDSLKGEWRWVITRGGVGGGTLDAEFSSIIKVLSQNKDTSINYEVFVDDTLFSKGNFQIQQSQWWIGDRSANIKLPHWTPNNDWIVYFGCRMNQNQSKDTLTFVMPAADGFNYYYQKTKNGG